MDILPENLQEIIDEHEGKLKVHFSKQVYTEILKRNSKWFRGKLEQQGKWKTHRRLISGSNTF